MSNNKHRGFRVRMPRKQGGRECLLYRVYRNMRGRAHGRCTKAPWIYAHGWPWTSYADFRRWALGSGFTKQTPSPDRIDTSLPYGPTNVRWVTVKQNNGTATGRSWYNEGARREPD
jgi:hypothetical protein